MVRVLAIGRPPYDPAWIDSLRNLGPLYHPDPNQDGFHVLVKAGLPIQPLKSEIPDGGVLLMPGSTGPLEGLVQISDRLLAPDGCPWDREQTHQSLKKYLLEEAYELFDAIDADDDAGMREELGDLALQPIIHAAMKRRDGSFSIDDVANDITAKLVRRHPHVFGDSTAADTDAVLKQWDKLKATEKGDVPRSLLAGVPKTMPALQRAYEVSKRAARVGFDWPSVEAIWDKVREEESELEEALGSEDRQAITDEFADLLFALVNIARWYKIEPEEALRTMVSRFTARFQHMEAAATVPLDTLTADEWDELWLKAKQGV